jgi:hypothetical protein
MKGPDLVSVPHQMAGNDIPKRASCALSLVQSVCLWVQKCLNPHANCHGLRSICKTYAFCF